MYAAKAAGKNRFLRFHPDMMTALVQRTDMESGLRLAVPRGEISVDFQPIVSHRMGQVVQVEALARWDRGGGRVPPSVFIPLAERTGLISEIGAEVMALSLVQLAPWLSEDPTRSLAVNVSAVQLQEPDFAERVLSLAEASGVAAYQLVVEVTESVFFDDDCALISQLSTLRNAGARVALDDFGTGYSSLGRLQDLPVDTVKIDKTFVSMVRTGQRTPAHPQLHDQHGTQPWPDRHGRRHRNGCAGRLPGGAGLRFAAGLPVFPAGAGVPPGAGGPACRGSAQRASSSGSTTPVRSA